MFSGRVLELSHGWFPLSLEGSGRGGVRQLRGQLASLWPKGQFPTVRKGAAALSVFPYGPILSMVSRFLPIASSSDSKATRQLMGAGWRELLAGCCHFIVIGLPDSCMIHPSCQGLSTPKILQEGGRNVHKRSGSESASGARHWGLRPCSSLLCKFETQFFICEMGSGCEDQHIACRVLRKVFGP